MNLLRHLAVIMDGNGRWAKRRILPRTDGHKRGAAVIDTLCEFCLERGVRTLTIYAFSTENWARPQVEVSFLMRLLGEFLVAKEAKFLQNGIRFVAIGDLTRFSAELQGKIAHLQARTRGCERLNLAVALNYGGRDEIVRAVRRVAAANVARLAGAAGADGVKISSAGGANSNLAQNGAKIADNCGKISREITGENGANNNESVGANVKNGAASGTGSADNFAGADGVKISSVAGANSNLAQNSAEIADNRGEISGEIAQNQGEMTDENGEISINHSENQGEITPNCDNILREIFSEKSINAALDTAGFGDVDLLIRTGGERRLSNFLLWQASYAELAFSDTLFPDLTRGELDEIAAKFERTHRRFGGL